MKSLQKILKISARYAFKKLRSESPYFCGTLKEEVFVTRIFWNHINFSKDRSPKDYLSRLAILPMIEEILKDGILKETREENNIFYHIEMGIENQKFSLIILRDKKKASKLFLISCFVDI